MRIPLLYQVEYSQWRERFMNYLEEQTDGEAMINSIQNGLPNDIYSLIDSNETAKDLWDALERQMRGSEYECGCKKDNCELNYKFLNNLQRKWKQYDPLALVAEKTKVTKRKEKVVVSSDSKRSGADDFNELKKITDLLAKSFNRRKFYSQLTNNNLRTSSTSQSANKKQEFVKSDDKKEDKKADEKKRDMSKVKCYNCKKEGHFAKDCKKAKEINANMVFMAQIEKVLLESDESSSSAEETIAEVAYYTSESESESEFETSEYYDNSTNYDYDKSEVDHNDSKVKEHLVDKLIRKFNHKIAKRIEKANQHSKGFENQNKYLQDKYDVLKNQTTTFEMNNNELNERLKVLIEKNDDLLAQTKAKLEEERYEYMIRYSALFDNDKQHRKQIADQEVLSDKMSVELVELDKHTVHMIMPSKDNLYNGLKRIGFENPSYFEKAKDLRPTLYDEKVIGLGYTLMFLTHSNEALEIKKSKRSRENKIEFAYDYGNLNASYVNEKINFEDDYFQEIINPDFEKIDVTPEKFSNFK
uniref:CCHC-type domain-containing protein n=1 Tax=Tanacetum cinerariifolium TaxID=118510 RepID=A0A699IP42_TANCI|nr:hypothetical protein [Tanacetum cinerariifolium]